MDLFQPTYLYIKRHSLTEKCYFGKTIRKDPVKYPGSGKLWARHIKAHGKEFVETLWFKLFTDKEELVKIATLFSEQQDIVKSDLWLNLKLETGIDGGATLGNKNGVGNRNAVGCTKNRGKKRTEESKLKMSRAMMGNTNGLHSKRRTGMTNSPELRMKISQGSKGHKLSEETKAKMKAYHQSQPEVGCPHCGMLGRGIAMKRWHFNNCKLRGKV